MGAFREEDIVDDRGAQSPRSADAIASALREAREYTLAMYAHLTDGQQRFPMLATVNPPRWEIGHVGWFQEFWCRRHATTIRAVRGRRRAFRTPTHWFDSSAVPHDTRWDLPLPDWHGHPRLPRRHA